MIRTISIYAALLVGLTLIQAAIFGAAFGLFGDGPAIATWLAIWLGSMWGIWHVLLAPDAQP